MAKAKRPSLSSSSNPELMKLLEEEEAAPFKIGIEAIIQHHLRTLNQSYNRIQKLLQTSSLIQSYKRLGRIHEVENDHVVFHDSSEALQKDIKSSIEVAQNITTIFQSILPRHTLDYVSDNRRFFLDNFSKSEDLKVSKFQKKTDFVRNKIVELAVKLYNLRTRRIKRSIAESVQYGLFRKNGTLDNVDFIEMILFRNQNSNPQEIDNKIVNSKDWILWRKWSIDNKIVNSKDWILWRKWSSMKKEEIITEKDEIMIKIEKAVKDLEGILFGIYVMVQTQVAISAYAISEKWSEGTCYHHDIESLAAAEKKKNGWWFKSKIIPFTNYYSTY